MPVLPCSQDGLTSHCSTGSTPGRVREAAPVTRPQNGLQYVPSATYLAPIGWQFPKRKSFVYNAEPVLKTNTYGADNLTVVTDLTFEATVTV
jgi:hypothetical protein